MFTLSRYSALISTPANENAAIKETNSFRFIVVLVFSTMGYSLISTCLFLHRKCSLNTLKYPEMIHRYDFYTLSQRYVGHAIRCECNIITDFWKNIPEKKQQTKNWRKAPFADVTLFYTYIRMYQKTVTIQLIIMYLFRKNIIFFIAHLISTYFTF